MKNINESGRSMVEMLGVLAIIGVLSVGGIAGYSKAMNKYKINKTTDQLSMLVANIRTLYSSQGNYKGLTNATAVQYGVVPGDMYTATVQNGTQEKYTAGTMKNAFNGAVTIIASPARGTQASGTGADAVAGTNSGDEAFIIEYAGLSNEACITIATGDWGSGQASGLLGIAAGAGTATSDTLGDVGGYLSTVYTTAATDNTDIAATAGKLVAVPGGQNLGTPVDVASAVLACNGGGAGNEVAWKYY
jgi:Tfp pilus assembly protein PilE